MNTALKILQQRITNDSYFTKMAESGDLLFPTAHPSEYEGNIAAWTSGLDVEHKVVPSEITGIFYISFTAKWNPVTQDDSLNSLNQ